MVVGKKLFFGILLVLLLVYVFLLPASFVAEPRVRVGWDLDSQDILTLPGIVAGEEALPMYTSFGLMAFEKSGEKATLLSDNALVVSGPNYLVETDTDGSLLFNSVPKKEAKKINGTLAIALGSSLVTLSREGNTFWRFDSTGREIWRFEGDQFVTVVDSDPSGRVFVGFSDGSIIVFSREGQVLWKGRPGRGKLSCIYGLSWAENFQVLAVISDVEPQQLILLKENALSNGGIDFEVVFRQGLPQENRQGIYLEEVLDGRFLVMDLASSIGVFDIESRLLRSFEAQGELVQIVSLARLSGMSLLFNTGQGHRLIMMKPDGRTVLVSDASAKSLDLVAAHGSGMVLSNSSGLQSIDWTIR